MRRFVFFLACAHAACCAQAQQADGPQGPAASTAHPGSSESRQWACNPPDRPSGDLAYPREAAALGLKDGHVLVQFTIEAGEIVDVQVVESTHRIFSEAAVKIVKSMNCKTDKGKALHGVRVRVPLDFRLR